MSYWMIAYLFSPNRKHCCFIIPAPIFTIEAHMRKYKYIPKILVTFLAIILFLVGCPIMNTSLNSAVYIGRVLMRDLTWMSNWCTSLCIWQDCVRFELSHSCYNRADPSRNGNLRSSSSFVRGIFSIQIDWVVWSRQRQFNLARCVSNFRGERSSRWNPSMTIFLFFFLLSKTHL